ncbi:hypothetical protein SUGI_0207010 [Cryptomeria japonica]|nr:hypothetical protein SUGI_0207010 [Cryptomeria japonica]
MHRFLNWFSAYTYFEMMNVDNVNTNELYSDVQLHLSNSPSISATRISRAKKSSSFSYSLADNEEKRAFVLWIPKKDTERVFKSYLRHIVEHASEIRRKKRDSLLYTNSKGGIDSRGQPWDSVPFKHPSTFDSLALDPIRKSEIIADLDAFAKGKQFYQNTGRAWKRGYSLHGRPGTEVRNAELRKLLIKTTNKAITVIEDIDCSLNLSDRAKKPSRVEGKSESPIDKSDDNSNAITLSGLLNFTDGLWKENPIEEENEEQERRALDIHKKIERKELLDFENEEQERRALDTQKKIEKDESLDFSNTLS